jgi:hypothetical protein
MKCLAQMFYKKGKEVIFMETVVDFRNHRHPMIECIPLPKDAAAVAPGYFKVSCLLHVSCLMLITSPGCYQ